MQWIKGALAALAFAVCGVADARAWNAASLEDLQRTAEAAPAEGLPVRIEALSALARARASGDLAQIDPAADKLFVDLARDFGQGAVAPDTIDPDWKVQVPALDLQAARAQVESGMTPSGALHALLPQAPDYAALRAALARTRAEPVGAKDAHGLSREKRLISLRASLERWRWSPRAAPPRRVEVHIPQFEAVYFPGDGAPAQTFAAIVGRPETPTPRFEAPIESVTLNPVWTPPASIVRELLPGFARDPGKAAREGFEVLDANGNPVAPDAAPWSARPFLYHLRQRPGPDNPLGRLRFNLPNPYAVYLHDTPGQASFRKNERAFSHGCVRVENPLRLGAALLGAPWDEATLQTEIARNETRSLPLPALVPVHVTYLTATIDDAGNVVYARDLYRLDAKLNRALDGEAAAIAMTSQRESCGS